jgi:hypothetical protein
MKYPQILLNISLKSYQTYMYTMKYPQILLNIPLKSYQTYTMKYPQILLIIPLKSYQTYTTTEYCVEWLKSDSFYSTCMIIPCRLTWTDVQVLND